MFYLLCTDQNPMIQKTVDFGSTSIEATVGGKIFSYMDFFFQLNNTYRKWRENGNPAANLRIVPEPSCYADSRGPGAKGAGKSGILDARAKVQLLVFAAPVTT